MNKEDILAKSREENKGADVFEKLVLEKAGRLAFVVGGCICILIVLFNNLLRLVDGDNTRADPKLSFAAWGIWLTMTGVQFMYKFAALKKKHELVFGLLYLLIGTAMLVVMALMLLGVM